MYQDSIWENTYTDPDPNKIAADMKLHNIDISPWTITDALNVAKANYHSIAHHDKPSYFPISATRTIQVLMNQDRSFTVVISDIT